MKSHVFLVYRLHLSAEMSLIWVEICFSYQGWMFGQPSKWDSKNERFTRIYGSLSEENDNQTVHLAVS